MTYEVTDKIKNLKESKTKLFVLKNEKGEYYYQKKWYHELNDAQVWTSEYKVQAFLIRLVSYKERGWVDFEKLYIQEVTLNEVK